MKPWLWVAGISLLTTAVISVAVHFLILDDIVSLFRAHLSPDGTISPETITRLNGFAIFLYAELGLAGLIVMRMAKAPFRKRVVHILTTRHFGTIAPAFTLQWTLPFIMILTVLFIVYYSRQPVFLGYLFVEDGVFETLSAIAFFGATFLLIRTALLILRQGRSGKILARLVPPGLIILALASLFVAFEEISWGQRIFGWSTPPSLATLNQQDEISIHNISTFSAFFELVYLLPLLLAAPMLWSWKMHWPDNKSLAAAFFPDPGLSGVVLATAGASLTIQGELLEELVALLLFLYSFQLLGRIRHVMHDVPANGAKGSGEDNKNSHS